MQGNALLALAAALLWGGGDFSGGMGVKTVGGTATGALRVVLLSHITSFTGLLVVATLWRLPFPHGSILAWGITAGVTGGLSLTAFYIALAQGSMGTAAAVSGLLAAAIPAGVSMVSEGSPGVLRLAGFLVAGGAIWLIAAGNRAEDAGETWLTWLAVGAGAGFGFYFVALKMAGNAGPVWAMATARMGSMTTCLVLILILTIRQKTTITITQSTIGWAALTALLDTAGNMLFVAATRAGRLDVAAVLASLYPATTILLAAWTLKERPTRRQGLGMCVAVMAVVMITL